MGTGTDAHCYDCGYHVDLPIGGGMSNFNEYAAWPVACPSCGEVRTANALASPLSCSKCGSTGVSLFAEPCDQAAASEWDRLRSTNMGGEPSIGGSSPLEQAWRDVRALLKPVTNLEPAVSWSDLSLSKGRFTCPKCGSAKLRFGTGFGGSMPILWD